MYEVAGDAVGAPSKAMRQRKSVFERKAARPWSAQGSRSGCTLSPWEGEARPREPRVPMAHEMGPESGGVVADERRTT